MLHAYRYSKNALAALMWCEGPIVSWQELCIAVLDRKSSSGKGEKVGLGERVKLVGMPC